MKNILVINVNIVGNSPQPIRMRNLIRHWQEKANITVITMNNFEDDDLFPNQNVKIIKAPYSSAGRLLISKNVIATKVYLSAKKNLKRRFRELLRKIYRSSIFYRMMFPDKFIFEHGNILRECNKIIEGGNSFDIVMVSAAPFSLLRLGRKLKKMFPGSITIYDTGDPFYGNSSLELIKPFKKLTKWFEGKYLPDYNVIVVPTQAMKNHYELHFGDKLGNINIRVIDQGFEHVYSEITEKKSLEKGKLRMLYAGGLYKDLREPFALYEAIRGYTKSRITLRIFGNIYKDLLPEDSDHFYYGGSINTAELVKEYEWCEVTVFIDNSQGIQVPGKVHELLGIKRPVLFIYCNPQSPTLEIIKKHKNVVLCKNQPGEIIPAIDKLIEQYDQFIFNTNLSEYTWPVLSEKYMEGIL